MQDAFISLWEKRETIDTSRPVKSYITTIIHHKCHNHLRDTRKFNPDMLGIENLLELQEIVQTDYLVAAELEAAIKAAIDELPEKCREIFLLNRYENLKYHEIAEQLQLSQKTVEAQMSKALQHLRIRLAEYLPALLMMALLNQSFLKGGNWWQ